MFVGNWIGPERAVQVKKMPRTSSLTSERRLDNTHSKYSGQYNREPRYFVGIVKGGRQEARHEMTKSLRDLFLCTANIAGVYKSTLSD